MHPLSHVLAEEIYSQGEERREELEERREELEELWKEEMEPVTLEQELLEDPLNQEYLDEEVEDYFGSVIDQVKKAQEEEEMADLLDVVLGGEVDDALYNYNYDYLGNVQGEYDEVKVGDKGEHYHEGPDEEDDYSDEDWYEDSE